MVGTLSFTPFDIIAIMLATQHDLGPESSAASVDYNVAQRIMVYNLLILGPDRGFVSQHIFLRLIHDAMSRISALPADKAKTSVEDEARMIVDVLHRMTSR